MSWNINEMFDEGQRAAAAYELERNARLQKEKEEEERRKGAYATFLQEMGEIFPVKYDQHVYDWEAWLEEQAHDEYNVPKDEGIQEVSSEKFEELLERYPDGYVYCQHNFWYLEVGNKTYKEI